MAIVLQETYFIVLPSAQASALAAQYPTGVMIPPRQAAQIYNVPIIGLDTSGGAIPPAYVHLAGVIPGFGPPLPIDPTNPIATPIIPLSDYDPANLATLLGETGISYIVTIESFAVTFPQGYFQPAGLPFGPSPAETITFFWVGYFQGGGVPPADINPPAGTPKVAVGARRWVDGFEIPSLGSYGSSSDGTQISRAASRSVDGMGYGYRANLNVVRQHVTNVVDPLPTLSWERFYLRLRTLGTGEDNIWGTHGTVEAGASVILNVTSAGALKAYNKGNGGYPGTLIGQTSALTLNKWYRVDIRLSYKVIASGVNQNAIFQLYLNGAISGINSTSVPGSGGLLTQQCHANSYIGQDTSQGASNGLECDFDDWISADEVFQVPGGANLKQFLVGGHQGYVYGNTGGTVPGFDLTSGSHVWLVRPLGFNAGSDPTWASTGPADWRTLLVNPRDNENASDILTNNKALASLINDNDYGETNLGNMALSIGIFPTSIPSQNSKLGFIVGGVQNLTAESMTANQWNTAFFTRGTLATGQPIQYPLASLGIVLSMFQKDATTTLTNLETMLAEAESLGFFGPEDSGVATDQPIGLLGIHNSPYPGTPANAQSLSNPGGSVSVIAGIYSGNNIGQDVFTKAMGPHWWWVRPLSGGSDGIFWFSSMMTSHGFLATGYAGDRMPQACYDIKQTKMVVRTAGPGAPNNSNSVQYQYIGVSDPSMRFMINGAWQHKSTVASYVNPLVDAGFNPDGVFAFIEANSGSATKSYFRGPGNGASDACQLDTGVVSSLFSQAAGSITSLTAMHTPSPQTAFSAWRRDDGSGNVGWVEITSYVGNGAGTQNVTLRLNGHAPMFAIVTPHNAGGIFRDPSNPDGTANSQTISGLTNTTTGITAGAINQITVGTTLNANGVTYEVFALAGGTTPWTNPTDGSGNPVPFTPVQPGVPTTSPYGPGNTPPTPINAGCISFGQAVNELANRLGDPGTVHWPSTELQRYLREALRVYNGLTLTNRNRASFNTVAAQAYYDLPTVIPSLRSYNVLDQDLLQDIQFSLQEPASPNSWIGTAMFTLQQVAQAIQRKRDMFLWITGAVQTRETSLVTPDGNGRIQLPFDIIELRRVLWTQSGTTYQCVRTDEWALNLFGGVWNVAAPPAMLAYSIGVTPPLILQFAPPPNAQGTVDIVSVSLGPTVDPTVGNKITVPDDYSWVVKWGALSDLLGQAGVAYDPVRADIARTLWDLGTKAATQAAVVLAAQITSVPAPITPLSGADLFSPAWLTGPLAKPQTPLLAGHNLLALDPIPDAIYSITLDVVCNMPMPVQPSDCFFEGGVAQTEAILDYAEFLAVFKEGPQQATVAKVLLQRFLTACNIAMAVDQAVTPGRRPLLAQQMQDERTWSRTTVPEDR